MAYLNAKLSEVVSKGFIVSMEGTSPVCSYYEMVSCAAEVIKTRRAYNQPLGVSTFDIVW